MPAKKVTKKYRVGAEIRKKKKVSSRLPAPPRKKVHRKKSVDGILHRTEKNPILEPREIHTWESKAAFNPAAVFADGKIHVLYRAIGDDDASVLGYARLRGDGITVEQRLPDPAFSRARKFEHPTPAFQIPYSSGGGWNGGCEDPRLTLIGERVYMIYVAFDGWGSVRLALTSIKLEDFLNQKWKWKKPVFISPPGEIHKNWTLFPEKINGKYAILTSITPNILVEYFGSLDSLDGTKFVRGSLYARGAETDRWDNWIRGAGPPPLKTKHGWLLLYHAMDRNDPNRYKLGAMLLDLKDPEKILYRSIYPVLEPNEVYENEGYKAGVVYACGAVVADDTLFVYYGGADKVTCVASAPLEPFLKELIATGSTKLKKISVRKS